MFVAAVGALVAAMILAGVGVEVVWATEYPTARPEDRRPSLVQRLFRHRADRPWFVACAVVVGTVLLSYPFVDWALRLADVAAPFQYWDFGAYTGALDRWRAGDPLYVRNDEGGYSGGYLYPPVFLLVVWPFDLLSFATGAALWEFCSAVFLWVSLQLLARTLGVRLRLWERGLALWALVGFHPLLFSVKQGQVSAFLAGLVTLSLVCLLAGRATRPAFSSASGACTALVGWVKLVYAPIGAHLLTDRRRFLGAVGAGIGVLCVSVAVFGVDAHLHYLDVLRWGKPDAPRSPLLWMAPYYRPFYAFGSLGISLRLLGCLAVVGLVLAARSEARDAETFALGVAAMPLLAPEAYTYYLTALVPAALVMVSVELDRDGRPALPLVALGLLHVHSFGLRLAVWALPPLVPFGDAAVPVFDATVVNVVVSLAQPGVWGALLLGLLAATRVAAAASWPAVGTSRFPETLL